MTRRLLLSIILAAGLSAAESHIPDCPATSGHAPLSKSNTNEPIEEGRRILVDADSYPREPATLTEGPTLYPRSHGGYDIRFALDRYDDVLVAVYGPDGQLLRRLGCGVLGPQVPPPFEADSLVQRISWDGRDAQGEPVPADSTVWVGVGMQARFDRFIAHDPGQMTGYINALSVDGQGRVYVGQHTGLRYDPQILRYDRDGHYLDMVYPSDPEQLAATGRDLQDVYQPVERFDGRVIPLKTGVWRYWIQRWEDFVRLPFGIGPDDRAYFVIGTPSKLEKLYFEADWNSRIFRIDDLDHFWFQPWDGPTHYAPVFLYRWDAAFCFDRRGDIYVACKSYTGGHGDYGLDDYRALGTVRRIDPETGQQRAVFRFRGEQAVAEPSAYLGTPKTIVDRAVLNSLPARLDPAGWQEERLPEDRIDSFCDIEDLCVADDGRILVVDGHPRRIKCYSNDGRWLGGIDGLQTDGVFRRFCDIAAISWSGERCYLLTTFLDDPEQRMRLLALDLPEASARVVWSVALDPLARFIAVDRSADTPLIWIGNGNGLASISRISDRGDRAGAVRHIGGIDQQVLIDPRAFTVDDNHNVYVHDHARGQLVRCQADGSNWRAIDVPRNESHERFAAMRRFHTGKDPHHRNQEPAIRSLCVDERHDRLLVSARAVREGDSWGFRCLTTDLEPVDFQLESAEIDRIGNADWEDANARQWPWQTRDVWGGSFGGFDAAGRLYTTSITWRRSGEAFAGLPSQVSIYDSDGRLLEADHVRYHLGGGSMTVDSQGRVYVYDVGRVPSAWGGYDFPDMTWGYWGKSPRPKGPYLLQRGDRPVTHLPEISHLVQFRPEGGMRFGEGETWAHRGGGTHSACGGCDYPPNLLACDAYDRIIAADVTHYCVNIMDTAGNLIGRFGEYGNDESVPEDGNARNLGLRNIYNVAAVDDTVYVCDRDARRIARVVLDYRDVHELTLPSP